MSLVQIVNNVCMKELDRAADVIEGELKAECPKRTGQTAASIHTEASSMISRRIGSSRLSMLYADQGNGGKGTTIRSTRPVDRLGRKPGKLWIMNGMHTAFRNSVSGYDGKHFVKEVADRHR